MSRDFYRAIVVIVVLAAGALLLSLVSSRPSADDKTYIPSRVAITPEIELLRDYVSIDTSNPPGNETAGALFLQKQLNRAGVPSELIESAPGRGNLYARLRGARTGEGLMLLHHIDVVPADPRTWTSPPFAGRISHGILHGRGALDMKGIGICHLQAFLSVAASPEKPERDLVFLATADEENGSELGLAWLLEHRSDLFEGIRYVITEGGITEMKAEKMSYFAVETGSKQFVELKVWSSSLQPLREARIRLEPRFNPTDPDRILPEVKEYFRAIAPHRVVYQTLLADIEATIRSGNFWRLPESYRVLTQNNLLARAPRREADGFSMEVVLQNLPDEDPRERIAEFEKLMAPLRVEVTKISGPAPVSSSHDRFFGQIVSAVHVTYGKVDVGPFIFNYGITDSRFLRKRGIASYGFSPFRVDFFQSRTIHAENESIRLDWFQEGVAMVTRLVRRHCELE